MQYPITYALLQGGPLVDEPPMYAVTVCGQIAGWMHEGEATDLIHGYDCDGQYVEAALCKVELSTAIARRWFDRNRED